MISPMTPPGTKVVVVGDTTMGTNFGACTSDYLERFATYTVSGWCDADNCYLAELPLWNGMELKVPRWALKVAALPDALTSALRVCPDHLDKGAPSPRKRVRA